MRTIPTVCTTHIAGWRAGRHCIKHIEIAANCGIPDCFGTAFTGVNAALREGKRARNETMTTLVTALGNYPYTAALKKGELTAPGVDFQVRGNQAGQPRLRADGARAEVRRRRDGDRHLSAGEGLQQADRAAALRDDGAASSTTRWSTARKRGKITVQDLLTKRLGVRS